MILTRICNCNKNINSSFLFFYSSNLSINCFCCLNINFAWKNVTFLFLHFSNLDIFIYIISIFVQINQISQIVSAFFKTEHFFYFQKISHFTIFIWFLCKLMLIFISVKNFFIKQIHQSLSINSVFHQIISKK